MHFRLLQPIILVAVLGGGLAACSQGPVCHDPLGCLALDPDQSLTIGAALPLTGPDRISGEAALGALQNAAVRQKSIDGHAIRIQKTDFDCTGTGAVQTAERLTGETTLAGVIATDCLLRLPDAQNTFTQAGIPVLAQTLPEPSPTAVPGTSVVILEYAGRNQPIDAQFTSQAAGLLFTAIGDVALPGPDGGLLIPRQTLQKDLARLVQSSK
jgi:hypothetical protein